MKWILAPRFREDKLRGDDQDEVERTFYKSINLGHHKDFLIRIFLLTREEILF